jgi:hypothetical protein
MRCRIGRDRPKIIEFKLTLSRRDLMQVVNRHQFPKEVVALQGLLPASAEPILGQFRQTYREATDLLSRSEI